MRVVRKNADDVWHGEPRTIRDFFAAAALQSVYCDVWRDPDYDDLSPNDRAICDANRAAEIAIKAYELADAMVAIRQKGQGK